MATKPYKKNAWSFRPNLACNPSPTSFDPQNPPPPPSSLSSSSSSNLTSSKLASSFSTSPSSRKPSHYSSPPKPRRHIFQTIEENREEHALQFYSKACKDNLQVKEKVKLQCKKSEAGLLMENSHLFRTRVENSKLLSRAKRLEDCHSGEQLWTMSLRDHWSFEPRIGDLYAARIDCSKEIATEVEQIGSPIKANLYDILPDILPSKKSEETSALTAYKHFLEKCEKRFSKMGVHRPEFLGFQVTGTRLELDIREQSQENMLQKESEENTQHKDCQENTKHKESQENTQHKESELVNALERGRCAEGLKRHLSTYKVCGPAAELDSSKVFLSGKPGEILNSRVTLQNRGSTILYYKWLQQPSGSVLEALRKGRGVYFDIMPRAGYIEPGETEQFFISFYPECAGVFTRAWFLDFSPKLLTPIKPLNLLGIAVAECRNSAQRKLLRQSLEIQQRNRGLEEVFSEVIDIAVKRAALTFMKKIPGFIRSGENFMFLRSNECHETPLYYDPILVQKFGKLALEIASWHNEVVDMEPKTNPDPDTTNDPKVEAGNFSVSSLILSVCDGQHKEEHQQKIHDLIEMMALPPHPISVLYSAMYKSISKMIDKMEEALEHMKIVEEVEQAARMEENLGDDESSEKGAVSDYEEGSDDAFDLAGSKMQNKAKNDVKLLLQEMVEHFFSHTDYAVQRIEPLVQEMIQSSTVKADTESASWIKFWFQRLLHSLTQ